MDFWHQDSITYYKQLENECNKRIHQNTNCLAFTQALGKSMEYHLDRVLVCRRLFAKWLKRMDVPNKDEFAAIAVRMVDYEEKLDDLEYTIYLLNKKQKENSSQIKILKESLDALLHAVEMEVRDLQVRKIKSLEDELVDLKQLFDK